MSLTGTWHYRRSLASRVTLLTAIAVGVTVTVVSLASYVTVRTQSIRTLDDTLRHRAQVVSQAADLNQSQVSAVLASASDTRLIYIDLAIGKQIFVIGNRDLRAGTVEANVAARHRGYSCRTVSADGQRYRMVAVPGETRGTAIVLSQSLEPTDKMLGRLGLVALFFGLAGVILAGLAGWGVARNGLRPVRRLTEAAENIAQTEKLEPIPVDGNDEIARLATAFNAMLGSLSASRDRQRQLVADAGHELRTPLTSLRTNIELLAQAAGSDRLTAQSRAEMLDDVQAQIAELTTLIGDLVELARDEPVSAEPQSVELSEILDNAVTRVRRRAPGVRFDVEAEPWWVTGDAAALERAVTNLLDNAAKWSPEAGTVTVRLADGTLVVSDEGPGIADSDLPHVFERFYRSTESRSMPGSGLGLSIVRSVAERHGGTATAHRAASGGAELRLVVPGSARPASDDAAAAAQETGAAVSPVS
ncbi:sensor histidine kinase [Nocardioides mangrovicus]|uniref:histidine kinase n=1 Tax=Nocardioides mangrovicus TaxID=2478913 RepID=A0A3L8NZ52_9ACTN|nr:HAMP domain-containing sensor histidine kinase [Nocardioides mangrovicus]RLV47937.1 sensor histidine kinase [Nocardioides mangrovicus]